jgi:hypothetical protein
MPINAQVKNFLGNAIEKHLVKDLVNFILEYSHPTFNHCIQHGYHLSEFCLQTDCLNKKTHKTSTSYKLQNDFKVHVCHQCTNVSIEVFNHADKLYVEEINKNIYFDLGSKNSEYYRLTRCVSCEKKQNVLFLQHHTIGQYSSPSPAPNKTADINISCYDHRWYCTIFQSMYSVTTLSKLNISTYY